MSESDSSTAAGTGIQVGRFYLQFEAAVSESTVQQARVLMEALCVYDQRNATYKDNWKRSGWRGALFKLKLKVERAWDVWWDATPDPAGEIDVDDLLDAINCAGMAVRQIESSNRDGSWW